MRRPPTASVLLCIALVAAGSVVRAGAAPVHPELRAAFAAAPAGAALPVWVVFADKGVHEARKAAPPRDLVTPRSLERRRRVRTEAALLDAGDLPLDESYVRRVAATGARIRQRSKWLNRVSVEASLPQVEALSALPGILSIEPLVRFRRLPLTEELTPDAVLEAPIRGARHPADALDYGPSHKQLQQIGVPQLHALGLDGSGVLVGHFDNGYRLLAHEALAGVTIVAAHDFVDGDADPAPPPGAPANWGAHGILTLSVLAGWAPGRLVGAAYGADYVLARTEDDGSETPLEEDNWVAAIEWADSLGIDVASTSLGYLDYDAPYPSWTWADMDGHTTAITRAAALAVGRGIVVVNSAGNAGFDATHNTLIAPADADSVITVGAVDSLGVRSSFSSVGPTTDIPARIKPDVAARGSRVHSARTLSTTSYGTASGTSLSCPLAAGVAALLVGARPSSTPIEIRDAMRLAASQAGSPDNLLGWGLLDAVAALALLEATDAAPPLFARRPVVVPNPFNPSTTIHFDLVTGADLVVRIADARGRLVRTLQREAARPGPQSLRWNGLDDAGRPLASGVYFLHFVIDSPAAPPTTVRGRAVLLR